MTWRTHGLAVIVSISAVTLSLPRRAAPFAGQLRQVERRYGA
jgi:hypothetical protein